MRALRTPTRGAVLARESALFVLFSLVTLFMTWPWAASLRDHVADRDDSYLLSWMLWWDWHATVTQPLRLFDANIFYPLKETLALSEHGYGIALHVFPLLALGVAPLTAHGVALLLGFALSGYGLFRLARTVTGSTSASLVAGFAFAFLPYRFHLITHLPYLFAGWIPLALESVVLFARRRTPGRAAWMFAAVTMNALVSIHWLVLTLIPLGATAAILAVRERSLRDRRFWVLGGAAALASGLVLFPFLYPYRVVSRRYGFVRSAEETAHYSARPIHWLTVDAKHRVWGGRVPGDPDTPPEKCLFPGLALLALPIVGLASLARRRQPTGGAPGERDAIWIGLVWASAGFLGSLGMNTPFHRFLFEHFEIFRAIRVPARCAMVGDVGLALMAAAGCLALAARLPEGGLRRGLPALLALLVLAEERTAPLSLVRGEPEPDEVSRELARLPASGGVLQLPSGLPHGNNLYTLRSADHRKPLVNSTSGFTPPHVRRIEELTNRPDPDPALLDLIETLPVSYVVVRESWLSVAQRPGLHRLLDDALSSGRLRYLGRFDGMARNDLYAVSRNEPSALPAGVPPWAEYREAPLPQDEESTELTGSMDTPAPGAVVMGDLVVQGWGRIAGEDLGVEIFVDGMPRRLVSLERVRRPDVAQAVPSLAPATAAGWSGTVSYRGRADGGRHFVEAVLAAADGRRRRLEGVWILWLEP